MRTRQTVEGRADRVGIHDCASPRCPVHLVLTDIDYEPFADAPLSRQQCQTLGKALLLIAAGRTAAQAAEEVGMVVHGAVSYPRAHDS